jgi:hypothetical protein
MDCTYSYLHQLCFCASILRVSATVLCLVFLGFREESTKYYFWARGHTVSLLGGFCWVDEGILAAVFDANWAGQSHLEQSVIYGRHKEHLTPQHLQCTSESFLLSPLGTSFIYWPWMPQVNLLPSRHNSHNVFKCVVLSVSMLVRDINCVLVIISSAF